MTIIRLRYVHDECGNDGQALQVYFRTDGVILIEGTCEHCAVSFVRSYDATEMLIQQNEREAA